MAITIDPMTHVVSVPRADLNLIQATPEVRELDLNWFRLQLKALEDNEIYNMCMLRTHDHNTEVELSGLVYARIVEMLDPYTVEFEDGQYTINCTSANHNLGDVKVANQVSLIINNAAGLISNAQIEYASFNGGVTIDQNNTSGRAVAGSIFPTGTPAQPSSNWTDALFIADFRGFTTFYINSDADLDGSFNLTDYSLIGESPAKTLITISGLATTDGVEIKNATVTGILDGQNFLSDCTVLDLEYVNGRLFNCGLIGDIELSGGADGILNDCYTVDQDDPPVINLGGSGQSLVMPNYSGLATLNNLSDGTQEVGVGLDAGAIVLSNTITAGTIIISGIGTCIDQSGGTATVDTSALISNDSIASAVWNKDLSTYIIENSASTALRGASYQLGLVLFDSVNGVSGTGWPVGTTFKPSSVLADALLIMFYGKVKDLVLQSDVTVTAAHDISGIVVRTIGLMGTDVVLESGSDADGTTFRNVNLSGEMTIGDEALVYDSSIGNLDNFRGVMNNVSFAQGSEISLDQWATIIMGTAGGDPTNEVEFSIGDASLNISQWTGNLKLKDKTGSDRTVVNCNSGNIIIDSTCVAGKIQLLGVGYLEADNSGAGCDVDTEGFITQDFIADHVWDEELADHAIAGSYGSELATKADLAAQVSTDQSSADSGVAIDGTVITGTYASMASRDGTYWQIQEDAVDGIVADMVFYLPSADHRPGVVSVFGRYTGNPTATHHIDLWAWNYETSTWELLFEEFLPGGNTSDGTHQHEYYERHIDRTNSNQVRIRLRHHTTTYNASHNMYIDLMEVTSVKVVTADAVADAVWADDVALRMLGLMQENHHMDQTVYQTYNEIKQMTSARIRLYSDAVSVGTDSNVIATYLVTSTWTDDEMDDIKIVKQ
ncbi:MAG: hypothetical protein DRQ42_01645 [Gammaproteobacteria bacterium]|nr:MAG: hypothetical protein DRQ42_01645 [Gammaproteobacteria bacterium]